MCWLCGRSYAPGCAQASAMRQQSTSAALSAQPCPRAAGARLASCWQRKTGDSSPPSMPPLTAPHLCLYVPTCGVGGGGQQPWPLAAPRAPIRGGGCSSKRARTLSERSTTSTRPSCGRCTKAVTTCLRLSAAPAAGPGAAGSGPAPIVAAAAADMARQHVRALLVRQSGGGRSSGGRIGRAVGGERRRPIGGPLRCRELLNRVIQKPVVLVGLQGSRPHLQTGSRRAFPSATR